MVEVSMRMDDSVDLCLEKKSNGTRGSGRSFSNVMNRPLEIKTSD